MKKIKLLNKLSLNKENVSTLNNSEQDNLKGGALPKTKGNCHIIGDSRGCACTGSRVKTCGIYCPADDILGA